MVYNQKNEINKKKAAMLKSIMTNPRLSSMVKDSMNAPIGSTKRQQSKAILSILKKMGMSDGMGGPGTSPISQSMQNVIPNNSYATGSSMMIFPAAPKFKVKPTGGNSNGFNGTGGPGDIPSSILGSPILKTSPFTVSSQTSPSITPIPTQKASIGTPSVKYPVLSQQSTQVSPFNYQSFGQRMSSVPQTMSPFYAAPSTTPRQTSVFPSGPQSTVATKTADQTATPASMTSLVENTRASASGHAGQAAITDTQGAPTRESIVNQNIPTQTSVSSGLPSKIDSVSGAVSRSMGPSAFAINAMSDIDTLKKLLPNVPEDMLPVGASLAGQIEGLESALKKEYDLENLQNRLANLQKTGGTLESDLKNYIRGKDEFVNYVDGLLDRVNQDVFRMDMANPEVRNKMENYQKYLYTMKGRQNQRYVDFLNSSINQYNAELDNLSNQYNNALTQYNETLKTKSAIAQDDYNRLYTLLTDMYTSAEEAPKKALELKLLEQELYNAQIKGLVDASDALGSKNSAKFWEEQQKYKDNIIDKDGNLLPNFNLMNALTQADSQGYALEGVLNLAERGINNMLSSQSPTDAIKSAKEYKDNLIDLASSGYGQVAENMGNGIVNKAGDVLSNYILENAISIKDALTDLNPKTIFGNKKPLPSRDDWVGAYKNSIDEGILNDIYDYVERETAANPSLDINFLFTSDGNKIDNATDEEIAQKVVAGVTEGWRYEIARAGSGI